MRTKLILGLGIMTATIVVGCAQGVDAPAGGHTVLRISQGESKQSGDCDNGTGGGQDTETSNKGEPDTWMLFGVKEGGGETAYLDTGSSVYEGAKDTSGAYSFTGKTVRSHNSDDAKTTETTTTTISLTPDGTSVSGTYVVVTSDTCSGSCGGIPNTKCTDKSAFVGVVIDEASDAPK